MKKPMHKHHEADQHSLAKFLDDWMEHRLDIDQACVVMRNVPWFTIIVLDGPTPTKWRLDWFPPGHYIRFCMTTKYVDTGDVFVVSCDSAGAARQSNSRLLSEVNIAATAAANKFDKAVLRTITWNDKRGTRKILPIGVMETILGRFKTSTAAKLLPDFSKVVDDIQNDRFEPVEETAIVLSTGSTTVATPTTVSTTTPTTTTSTAMTTVSPGTLTMPSATMMVPTPISPFNPYQPKDMQIRDVRSAIELQQSLQKMCKERNDFNTSTALADAERSKQMNKIENDKRLDDAEHASKKRKIEGDQVLQKAQDILDWAKKNENTVMIECVNSMMLNMVASLATEAGIKTPDA